MKEYIADFETVVPPEGAKAPITCVWGWTIVELGTENVKHGNTLSSFMAYCNDIAPARIGFHNLRFDGTFIASYLLKLGYEWVNRRKLLHKEFTTLISDKGQWYTMSVNLQGKKVEFWDTLKLIPMSVKKIGDPKKGFGTKHSKLTMDYKGHKWEREEITKEELEYMENDVLVVKEALEYLFGEGVNSLTIGGAALQKMKKGVTDFETFFPSLDYSITDTAPWLEGHTADSYCRMFYYGGITQVDDENGGKELKNLAVIDKNSMYPSMMRGVSGNRIPCGNPVFFKGGLPEAVTKFEGTDRAKFWFARIRCSFELKENHIPTIQIKDTDGQIEHPRLFFGYRDFARNSAVYGVDRRPVLYVSCVDWKLINEQYDVKDVEWIDGCWFWSEVGPWDEMLEPLIKMKENAPNVAVRTIAKLLLNNLYGKLATAQVIWQKKPFLEDGVLKFEKVESEPRTIYHVASAAAITAYARYDLIHTAQKFKDNHAFCYCDTDSIHYLRDRVSRETFESIPLHEKKLNHWGIEADEVTEAKFVRPKTYAERYSVDGALKWNITACGLSPEGKSKVCGMIEKDGLLVFDYGLKVPGGKRVVKNVCGGAIITDTSFQIKEKPERPEM